MSDRMQKIVQRIADGLTLSARAVAWREGQEWEPETPERGPPGLPEASVGLIEAASPQGPRTAARATSSRPAPRQVRAPAPR